MPRPGEYWDERSIERLRFGGLRLMAARSPPNLPRPRAAGLRGAPRYEARIVEISFALDEAPLEERRRSGLCAYPPSTSAFPDVFLPLRPATVRARRRTDAPLYSGLSIAH